jgi:hypothetical protein
MSSDVISSGVKGEEASHTGNFTWLSETSEGNSVGYFLLLYRNVPTTDESDKKDMSKWINDQ